MGLFFCTKFLDVCRVGVKASESGKQNIWAQKPESLGKMAHIVGVHNKPNIWAWAKSPI